MATLTSSTKLVKYLHDAKTFMIGDFKLKSGQKSPVYIDLRGLISSPAVLKCSLKALWDTLVSDNIEFDCICGVPYAALPLATGVCLNNDIPMLMRRKEAKDYGTKKLIEGKVTPGQRCLIIEDVVTEGSSILETAVVLRAEGLIVHDAIVLINRQQGARKKLSQAEISLHSVLTLDNVLDYMVEIQELTSSKKDEIKEDLQKKLMYHNDSTETKLSWDIEERISGLEHPKAKRLLRLVQEKQTNLCVAADSTTADQILQLAREIGNYICVLKIHADIIEDFSDGFVKELQGLALQYNFLLFEDRKYSDVGNTVVHQFQDGHFKVSSWADFVTVHSVSGPGVIDGIRKSCHNNDTGVIIVAEMSSQGNLCADSAYKKETIKMAKQNKDIVVGFICQKRCCPEPGFIYLTPGVHLGKSRDSLGQQFRDPRRAVIDDSCDIIIVGRGIYESCDPISETKKYQKDGFHAFIERKNQ